MTLLPEYFARLATLPSIGKEGVSRLQSSKVVVVGVGGVGSAIAYYLSRSGIGYLRLVDQDIILESNLSRMHSVGSEDIFKPKAEALAAKLGGTYNCQFDPVVDTLSEANHRNILSNMDVIVDGLDNFRSRHILNKFSVENNLPYVFTSCIGEQLNAAVFDPKRTGCLDCVMPIVPDHPGENCETIGVSAIATGMAGILAAQLVLNTILGVSTGFDNHLLTVDLAGPDLILSKFQKSNTCRTCGPQKTEYFTDNRDSVFILCGEKTVNILPDHEFEFDPDLVARNLPQSDIVRISNSVIVYRHDDHVVSLFRNGRIMIEGVSSEKQGLEIARKVWLRVGLATIGVLSS